jgi:hypothetical protein
MDTEQTQVNLLVVCAFESLRIPYYLGEEVLNHGCTQINTDFFLWARLSFC